MQSTLSEKGNKTKDRPFLRFGLISILLILVITQWAIITYLLVQKQNRITSSITSSANTGTSTVIPSSGSTDSGNTSTSISTTTSTTTTTTTSILEEQQHKQKKYEGVATTLMINAPKWFQRRYSMLLSNVFTNTPKDWAIQIFYVADPKSQSQIGFNINPNLLRLNATDDRIILTPLPSDLVSKFGQKRKLLYWTNEYVWKSLVSENVLMFNGNGVICSNAQLSLLDGSMYETLFQHVDYVGSPWRTMYGEGGEGSYSFRNRDAMLDVIRYKPFDINKDGKEDMYFLQTMKEMNKNNGYNNDNNSNTGKNMTNRFYRIATKKQTHLFAGNLDAYADSGNNPPPLPMVVSGTLANLDHDVRQNVLSACPELGMMFPLLHHPSCFGAHPDGEECGRHICALKDNKERPGGC